MSVTLNRILKTNNVTIGELNVNGTFVCNTLEDRLRPLPEKCPNTPNGNNCNCKEKVYGETAVPAGTYIVRLSYSSRFKRIMPEICTVPHFLGIRIHSGNKTADTEGCVIVGDWTGDVDGKVDWVSNSKVRYNKLLLLLQEATDKKEKIIITINNL